MAAADRSKVLGPAQMSKARERVRFVLRARLHQMDLTQSDLLRLGAAHPEWTLSKNRLSAILHTGDVTSNGSLSFVRLVERVALHDNTTSAYATRILLGGERADLRGDSKWWASTFSKQNHYTSALEVVVAGLSLLRFVDETSESEAAELLRFETSRRNTVMALCRVATGNFGHAHDALKTLARLGEVAEPEVSQMMTNDPFGGLLARAADGAMRRPRADRESSALIQSYADAALALPVSADAPSRMVYELRLLRRVALDGPLRQSAAAAERLIEVARDTTLPVRWRRFALWVGAEPAVRRPDRHARSFDSAVADLESEPLMSDVARRLLGLRGSQWVDAGYQSWPSDKDNPRATFDLFKVGSTDPATGSSLWELPNEFDETRSVLDEYAMQIYRRDGGSRHRSLDIGADIYLRFVDALLESLVHPGLIRAQAASDMFIAAGSQVCDAAVRVLSRIISEMANSHSQGSAAMDSNHHPAVLDSALTLLGVLRRSSALETLVGCLPRLENPHLRATCLWSMGDILAGWSTARGRDFSGAATALRTTALDATESATARKSAIHAIGVSRTQELLTPTELDLLERHDQLGASARWARCLLRADYLNEPIPMISRTIATQEDLAISSAKQGSE